VAVHEAEQILLIGVALRCSSEPCLPGDHVVEGAAASLVR
jgi:hypothetical protein